MVGGGGPGLEGAGFDVVVELGGLVVEVCDAVEAGWDGGEHVVTPLVPPDSTADGRLPSMTLISLSARLELSAHWQRLEESAPCPTMVDPLPFRVRGLVTTGKPAPGLAPPVMTAYVHPAVRLTVPPPPPLALTMAASRPDAPPFGPEQGTSTAALA